MRKERRTGEANADSDPALFAYVQKRLKLLCCNGFGPASFSPTQGRVDKTHVLKLPIRGISQYLSNVLQNHIVD